MHMTNDKCYAHSHMRTTKFLEIKPHSPYKDKGVLLFLNQTKGESHKT